MMKHHLKVEIKAKDTQSLEEQLKELIETCNINLALACKCGGYDFSEKAGEDQTVIEWRCCDA